MGVDEVFTKYILNKQIIYMTICQKATIATEFIFATVEEVYEIYFKKTNYLNDILANVNNFFGLGQACPFGAGYSIIL